MHSLVCDSLRVVGGDPRIAEGLGALDIGRLPIPFVIKPAVGFFSLGVHRVSDPEQITLCLHQIGKITNARNLPVHAELRRFGNGFIPIEINALRFGGWCTTADLTERAFGFNPYLAFFHRQEPDWPKILKDKGDEVHSIVVLDNSTGIDQRRIARFDYDRFLARFSNPLELRKVDFSRYPLFGFVFVETPGHDRSELDWILGSDLREFVTIRP